MKFLADENFNNRIVRGVRLRYPELDVIRVQDTELYGAEDPIVLEWAANEGRIVLTHDIETMPNFAYQRVQAGKPMIGVIAIPLEAPIGAVIEDLLMAIGASEPSDFADQVVYFPL